MVTARSLSAERIWSVPTAPPPNATTAGVDERRASTACFDSRSRKAASPPVSKIRAIGSYLLDLAVDVDERPAEPLGERRAERRLAGAHEADQGDVTV